MEDSIEFDVDELSSAEVSKVFSKIDISSLVVAVHPASGRFS